MSNIRKFYLFKFFTIFTVTNPILTYFMLAKGLSVSSIFVLSSWQRIAGIIVEVPTGAISDTRGHKYNLMLGTASFVISCLIFAIGSTFFHFLWAEVFMALAGGFISGADTAFVYESLERCNRVDIYEKVFGQMRAVQSMVTAGIMLLVGFVAEVSWSIPFYITAVFGFIAFLIACTFKEPATLNQEKKVNSLERYSQYFQRMRDACFFSFKHVEIRWFLLYAAILSVGLSSVDDFYQIFMKNDLHLAVKYSSIVYVLLYVGQAFFSSYTGEGLKLLGYERMFSLMPLLGIFTLLGMIYFKNITVLILFVLPYIATGFSQTVISGYLNRRTNPGQRATVASLRQMMRKSIYIFFAPLVGFLHDKWGLNDALLVIALLLALTMTIPIIYKRKYNLNYEVPQTDNVAVAK